MSEAERYDDPVWAGFQTAAAHRHYAVSLPIDATACQSTALSMSLMVDRPDDRILLIAPAPG